MQQDITGTWEEVIQTAEQGATIYTVNQETGDTVFYSVILTPKTKHASWMGYFNDPGEASQETKAQYGQDIVYVSAETFKQAVLARQEL